MTDQSITDPRIRVGSVVQMNERIGSPGYVGCFMLVTEVRPWGVMGFVPHVQKVDEPAAQVWMRAKFECIEFVGTATLVLDERAGGAT